MTLQMDIGSDRRMGYHNIPAFSSKSVAIKTLPQEDLLSFHSMMHSYI